MAIAERRIWVLLGAKAGDNAQALALARRVGGHVEEKRLDYRSWHVLPNWVLGAGLASVSPGARAQLCAPWPDLVIGVGKRSAPVARWIKMQSHEATRIVQLGRPRTRLDAFDLVITTPQYGLPAAGNVVLIDRPFAEPALVADEQVDQWAARWRSLARPWLVVAVGAQKFPQRLGREEIARFGAHVDALAKRSGANVLVFSSPRSAPGVAHTVAACLTVPHWVAGEGDRAYAAAIKLGDMFVVTSDSVSMLTEMSDTGKQVYVFRLPVMRSLRWHAQKGLGQWLAVRGLVQPPRDSMRFVEQLIARGAVVDIGAKPGRSGASSVAAVSRDNAVDRVRSLLRVGFPLLRE